MSQDSKHHRREEEIERAIEQQTGRDREGVIRGERERERRTER